VAGVRLFAPANEREKGEGSFVRRASDRAEKARATGGASPFTIRGNVENYRHTPMKIKLSFVAV
jgi:hypothetical protein